MAADFKLSYMRQSAHAWGQEVYVETPRQVRTHVVLTKRMAHTKKCVSDHACVLLASLAVSEPKYACPFLCWRGLNRGYLECVRRCVSCASRASDNTSFVIAELPLHRNVADVLGSR